MIKFGFENIVVLWVWYMVFKYKLEKSCLVEMF